MSLPQRRWVISAAALAGLSANARAQNAPAANAQTTEIASRLTTGNSCGQLIVPNTAGPYAVVIYVRPPRNDGGRNGRSRRHVRYSIYEKAPGSASASSATRARGAGRHRRATRPSIERSTTQHAG